MRKLTEIEQKSLNDAIAWKNKNFTSEKNKYDYYLNNFYKTFDFIVDRYARKYRQFFNWEDLKQEGRMAMMLALDSYKAESGNWLTWASYYVRTRMMRNARLYSTVKIPLLKTKFIKPYKISLEDMSDPMFTSGSYLEDSSSGDTNGFLYTHDREIKDLVYNALKQLSSEEQTVLKLRGIKEHSIDYVAKELKISRHECVKLLNKAKENLKKKILSLQ